MSVATTEIERLLKVGRRTSDELGRLPGVVAVAQGGSAATGCGDEYSDVDLYVYCEFEPDCDARDSLVRPRAKTGTVLIDHGYFEGGDAWEDRESGTSVDVMYRKCAWIEERIEAVLDAREISLGYTTALLFNVGSCIVLSDETGWLGRLKERCGVAYPNALAEAIIGHNRPMLRDAPFSYRRELDMCARRGDVAAAVHVTDRFLASYFDVLFALNRRAIPGEKRLLDWARTLPLVPSDFTPRVNRLLAEASAPATLSAGVMTMDDLIAALEELL